MSPKHILAVALVAVAGSASPAAAITDPPASTGSSATGYYTPEALKAQALRWQAMADLYGSKPRPDDRGGLRTTTRNTPVTVLETGNGFDWGDAGIGAATGFLFAACAASGIVLVRRERLAL